MAINLFNKSLLTLLDLTAQEISFLLKMASGLRAAKAAGNEQRALTGKNLLLVFDKASTRTHSAFEIAARDQGAHVTYLGPEASQLGRKESMKDTARILGRVYDGIAYRGYEQELVEILAENAGVPVWNALTNAYHPTEVLADLLTLLELSPRPLHEVALCYVGDARNNMANSLMIGCCKMGMDVRIGAPRSLWPEDHLIKKCRGIAALTGAKLLLTEDAAEAARGADYIYTDVWVSMGEPDEVWAERISLLRPYQVNSELMKIAGDGARFMHCLPALHNCETILGEQIYQKFGMDGLEVTNAVFEADSSIVLQQVERRVPMIKAVMVATLGNN